MSTLFPVRRAPKEKSSPDSVESEDATSTDATKSPDPVHSTVPLEAEPFQRALATWYRKHARELPWRGVRNPYGTWLSEIMLQQTRVATVIERYSQFLQRFPSLPDLAAAPEDDVLALWSGLGYYRRARMLHRGAQFVVRELNGVLPETATELRTLPGVGQYTAAAIASIAFGQRVAVLDGNVERVLLRLLGQPEERSAAARNGLLRTADALVPEGPARRSKTARGNPPGDHNQAMMELGATICLPRGPLCLQCPVFAFCRTRGEHPTGKRPALRSRHVACLLTTRKIGVRTEVLLERRPVEASLMPGMLELPPLPLEAAQGREPALRLRHSITDTNYYVEVYAEGAAGGLPAPESAAEPEAEPVPEAPPPSQEPVAARLPFGAGGSAMEIPETGDDATESERRRALVTEALGTVFRGDAGLLGMQRSLQERIPAAADDLVWCSTHLLGNLPLTGLARKALQRMGLMPMQAVRVRETGSV